MTPEHQSIVRAYRSASTRVVVAFTIYIMRPSEEGQKEISSALEALVEAGRDLNSIMKDV